LGYAYSNRIRAISGFYIMKQKTYIPIQIIGTQRSGSNLLRLMLNELPEVIAPHPPHILKTFMPLISKYPNLTIDDNFRQLIEDICQLIETNPVVWDHVIFDRDQIFGICTKRTLIEIFKVVYELMAEANGASYWCCKSMANVNFAEQIEEGGLQPYYIHLVRDGRDVASSFKKVAVGDKHIYSLSTNWDKQQKQSEACKQVVGVERVITVRYEDLIRSPEETMKRVCNFIGVTFTTQVFDFYNSEESKHTAASGFMWSNVTSPIIKNNTQKYKTALTAVEIRLFDFVAGESLLKYGYEVEEHPNAVKLDEAMINEFELENDRLKSEIKSEGYLKVDISKRKDQEIFVVSVKARLSQQDKVEVPS